MKIGITSVILFFTLVCFAQKDNNIVKNPSGAIVNEQGAFRVVVSEPSKKSKMQQKKEVVVEKTILEELIFLGNHRDDVEMDVDLSPSERANQILKTTEQYNQKKTQFMTYVTTSGVLNISKKEQGYYLYLLKYNDLEAYKRMSSLIKNAKQ